MMPLMMIDWRCRALLTRVHVQPSSAAMDLSIPGRISGISLPREASVIHAATAACSADGGSRLVNSTNATTSVKSGSLRLGAAADDS